MGDRYYFTDTGFIFSTDTDTYMLPMLIFIFCKKIPLESGAERTMSRPDHSVQFLVSHFKEDIDRFLRNLASGFIYLPIERNRFHFGPVPPPTDLGGAHYFFKNMFFWKYHPISMKFGLDSGWICGNGLPLSEINFPPPIPPRGGKLPPRSYFRN